MFGKSSETPVLGLKTSVSENSELKKILDFVLFFPKITKNDELQKSRKTRSYSKTDLNDWFKVQNAGPYI